MKDKNVIMRIAVERLTVHFITLFISCSCSLNSLAVCYFITI